jgi:type IV secretory pathway VirB2 component (pilin)
MNRMKKAKKAIGVIASVGIYYIFSGIAFAQTMSGGQNVTLCDPLGNNCAKGSETFATIAGNVAQFLLQDIAIPLAVVMVLVGAFQLMTSGGDPEKVSKGRKTILYTVIGLLAAFISLGIVNIIKSVLGQ